MNRNLSFKERLHNAIATQAVQHLKVMHCYLHGFGYDHEEFDLLWYKSPNTTWGHGFGRMIGFDEMYLNHVWNLEDDHASNTLKWERVYPELMGHDLRAVCRNAAHALSSEVIEVADDGMSARSFYLTPGILACSIGFDAYHRGNVYMWERYGSDFIFTNGEWKWFHEQVCPDIWGEYDYKDWAMDAYVAELNGPVDDLDQEPAALTDAKQRHKMYRITNPIQRTVQPPEPYRTLDEDHTVSPGYSQVEM